jgi:hypothetical protein
MPVPAAETAATRDKGIPNCDTSQLGIPAGLAILTQIA